MSQRNLNATERTERTDQALAGAPNVPGEAADGVGAQDATAAIGAMIVAYRRHEHGRLDLLLLHRAANGAAYEGDWAWTPPAGQREPGETIDACARRELLEETGLDLVPRVTDGGSDLWPVYLAEAAADAQVTLEQEPEHDRFAWFSPEEALDRCRPDVVRRSLQDAVSAVSAIHKTYSATVDPTMAVSPAVTAPHGGERVT
ncbi:MAG TPA: NUDIX domain-containing protein [Chloroflexota bacterium]|nr:NUDIX domain-containing protein [Chloroflexota bacterium]